MSQSHVIFALFALSALQQVSSLNLTVFYESLCPDSIRFITRQLYPTYQILDFDVEFIPYGKAAHNTDPWSIRCQHGPNECLGNAVQACALARITNTTDQVDFVNCVMSSSFPPSAGKWCADSLKLTYDGVSSCSTGDEGRQLLTTNGDTTHGLNPRLTFVPTIILNGKYSDEIQNLALTNLPEAICTTDPTVNGCNRIRRFVLGRWK